MLNLKSTYFYFLAIKISLLKFIKKIYFTTNIYNKSLKSRIPKQFYFFPNAFLLSSFTSYKNFIFKISEIDPNKFWSNKISKNENKNLHNFLWLSLIDRKDDTSIIRKIITLWMYKNNNYKPTTWKNEIISGRVLSWILNANIILSNTNHTFNQKFLESIIVQTNHLKKNFNFEKDENKKIESLTAILLSGLVFKEYKENYNFGIKVLEKLVEDFFDEDGFPLTRNPNDLLKFLKFLILIKECISDAQEYMPEFLELIIEKNLICLKNITTPNNQIPLFNGGTEIELFEFYKYISDLNIKCKNLKKNVGGLKIIKNKRDVVFFDSGSLPEKKYSNSYQSGSLSFEYYNDGEKIITNCGYGSNISPKARLLSRLTSAQSTLCLNDTSLVKFERNKMLNNAFGYSLKGKFRILDENFEENESQIVASASHNAYINNYGYIHKRQIILNKKNNTLKGTDELIKKKNIKNVNFCIRFHLYPGLDGTKTISGNSILIKIKKNKSLIFTVNNHSLSLEKSIFLGRNKILNNLCIAISDKLFDENKVISWEIKKNI
jgi:uncharacterized heparinase superfamily protein